MTTGQPVQHLRVELEFIQQDVISMVPSRLVEANRHAAELAARIIEIPVEDAAALLPNLQELKRCLTSASRTYAQVLELASMRECHYAPDGAPATQIRSELRVDG